jgi:hypothetical protein
MYSGLVQALVQERHGVYPILTLLEHLPGFIVGRSARLQTEQAGNDLQIVLYAVVDLLEQRFFFSQRGMYLFFGKHALGDIAQDYRVHVLALHVHFGNRGLSRKLGAVFAAAEDLAALPHAPGRYCGSFKIPDMLAVNPDEPRRQEDVERLSHHLFRGVAEDFLRALVEQDDVLLAVHRNDGVVSQIQDFR